MLILSTAADSDLMNITFSFMAEALQHVTVPACRRSCTMAVLLPRATVVPGLCGAVCVCVVTGTFCSNGE